MNEQKKVIKAGDDVVYTSVNGTHIHGVVVKTTANGRIVHVVFKGETEAHSVFTDYLEVIDNKQFKITLETSKFTWTFTGNSHEIIQELESSDVGIRAKMFEFCRQYGLKEITVNGELKMTVEEV